MTIPSRDTLYHTNEAGVRPSFGSDRGRALEYYARYVAFVSRSCPAEPLPTRFRLLDVGCGSGWSTFAFGLAGYDAVGIDLSTEAFEPPASDGCVLQKASALDIPHPDGSFDVVASYQFLEHACSPEKALGEMVRVCKPSGVVCVAGPNLLSPLIPILFLLNPLSWRLMSFRRSPGMPRHPYGNTLWELLASPVTRSVQLVAKLCSHEPHFTMRVPDSTPPFHADNDAAYLCNPTDLITYFRSRGFRVERRGGLGRPWLTYLVAGGTWVAARKPAGLSI